MSSPKQQSTANRSDSREWYLARFEDLEKRLNGESSSAVHELRRAGIDRFAESGLPTGRDEDWRHADVGTVTRTHYVPLPSVAEAEAVIEAGQLPRPTAWEGSQLVFVNGRFAPALSTLPESAGVRVMALGTALEREPDTVRAHLDAHSSDCHTGFAALNTAFLQDGAFVHFTGAGADPVHILYVTTDREGGGGEEPFVTNPRTLIVADANTDGLVVERFTGLTEAPYLTNAVTEIVAGQGSRIDHCKLQQEGDAGCHVATLHVTEARDCSFTAHNVTLSGRLVRNDVTTLLDGEGIVSTLNGLCLSGGSEHVDNHTAIEHAQPHCSSHELYKGILGGRATGVFRGKIHVHVDAQQTDAYQSNKNLLVSPDADITSKPQLEIYADDVKCSHGSTTGQLDADAIFYLRARGLSARNAVRVLTEAFANEIVDRIPHEALRADVRQLVDAKLQTLLEGDER